MTSHHLAAIALLALFPASLFAADAPQRAGWHLIWSDEFDGAAVDPAKWRVEDAALVKNNELQYYSPEDVYVSDGALVIRSQKRELGGRQFTSGLIESRGKRARTYGRFEFRAMLPKGQGLWPAIWMLPDDGSWPPEIDIMELVGSEPKTITMSFHYGQWPNHDWDTDSHIDDTIDYSQGFHDFALEWERGALRWYVDDVERFHVTNNVPDKPCFLIINTAVGGDMPGDPDDTTTFPQFLFLDYARVYAKEIPGTFFLTTAADHGRIVVQPAKERYNRGEKVTLKAVPFIGYTFDGWSGDSDAKTPDVTLTMDAHKNVQATFAVDPNAPPLISQGKTAKASSIQELDGEDVGPGNAVDGKPATRWSSKFSDPQWLAVDLGSRQAIEAIRIQWENAYAKAYAVELSDDGTTWAPIYSTANGRGRTEEILARGSGRYIRLLCKKRATEWGCSVFEFDVFGRPAP